jgi:hypothetical protein
MLAVDGRAEVEEILIQWRAWETVEMALGPDLARFMWELDDRMAIGPLPRDDQAK